MKADISRLSHRPGGGRSGVVFQQGRVVTDSDLSEIGRIAADMADAALDHSFGSGVPAVGGAVDVDGLALRAGTVIADGLVGTIAATGTPSGRFGIYGMQRDYPRAPAVPSNRAGFYYADLWRRLVTADEDPALLDVALGSEETSAREVTVAQIRWAPAALAGELGEPGGRLPPIGTGTIAAAATAGTEGPDPCDPCATEVEGDLALDNLFLRVEIVHVEGPANAPTAIEVAWSRENGSVCGASDPPDPGLADFGLFEHHSRVSDLHMGAFADSGARARSAFTETLPGAPSPATDGAAAWERARRWDGMARIDVAARTATKPTGATGYTAGLAGTGLVLTVGLEILSFTLTLTGRDVLTGDAWGILVRDRAADAERVVPVNGGKPIGIRHHYLKLLSHDAAGQPVPLTDAEKRRLSAPTLSNIPATHVALDPNTCPKLFAGKENVQEALAALCGIDAADIPFTNNCPGLWDGAATVQQALDRLCRTDFSPQQGYRILFDWGVACGMAVSKQGSGVRVEPGAFLDRAGRLTSLDAAVTLDIESGVTIHGARPQAGQERCLSVAAAPDGTISWHLSDTNTAFGPADKGYEERLRDIANMGKTTGAAASNTGSYFNVGRGSKVGKSIRAYASTKSSGMQARMSVDPKDAEEAREATLEILALYEQDVGEAAAQPIRNSVEPQLNNLHGGLSATELSSEMETILGTIYVNIEASKHAATCAAQLTPCPPPLGPQPWLVPVGCVTVGVAGGRLVVQEACAHCCRKQALTLRSLRYRMYGGGRHQDLAETKASCCRKKEPPTGGGIDWGDFEYDPEVYIDPDWRRPKWQREKLPPWQVDPLDDPRPDVRGDSVAKAREKLQNFGLEIERTIELEEPGGLVELDELTALPIEERFGSTRFKAGDKVALLTFGGEPVGWQVVERGDYVSPYAKSAVPEAAVKEAVAEALGGAAGAAGLEELRRERSAIERLAADLQAQIEAAGQERGGAGLEELRKERSEIERLAGELQAQRKAAEQERDLLKKQVEGMTGTRDGLVAEIGRLERTRDGVKSQVDGMREELGRLDKRHGEVRSAVEDTLKTLASLREDAQKSVAAAREDTAKLTAELRAALPVNAATGVDAKTATGLLNANVRTVADAAAISDAKLDEVAKASGVDKTKLVGIRKDAVDFTKRGNFR